MAKPVRFRGKWRIRPMGENGERESYVFDDYRDAVRKLKEREHEVEEVRRGARSATPAPRTFSELCDYWIEQRVPTKRSGDHDKSIIRKHLRPAFGALLLRDLSVKHVDAYVVEREHLNRKTIANHLTTFIAMLNVAVDLGWLLKVPRIRKPKVRVFDADYSYLRTDEEIRRFLRGAHQEGPMVFSLYATAVYTGMRAGELAGLRWDDVSFERRLITVQRSFNGPTKAGDVRYVPILDVLLPILKRWRELHPGTLVFANRDGGMLGRSARIFQEVLHRVLDRAGLAAVQRDNRTERYIVFHDLRHTFASHWMLRGGDLFKLQRLLGHKTPQMTNRYAHLAPEAYTADHGRFGGASLPADASSAESITLSTDDVHVN